MPRKYVVPINLAALSALSTPATGDMAYSTRAKGLVYYDGAIQRTLTGKRARSVTGSVTLNADDDNGIVRVRSNSAVTITIPQQSTADLVDGFSTTIFTEGDGDVSIVTEGTDALFSQDSSFKLKRKGSWAKLSMGGTASPDDWNLWGDLRFPEDLVSSFNFAAGVDSPYVGPELGCSRLSVARYHDANGYLATASANTQRVNWITALTTGVTTAEGLLVEGTATNLLLSSLSLGSPWTVLGATRTTNNVTGPDNVLLSGTKLIESTANSRHALSQTVSLTNTNIYALSYYVAPLGTGSKRYINISLSGSAYTDGISGQCLFDLENYTVVGNTGSTKVVDSYMQRLANGWTRLVAILALNNSGSHTVDIDLRNTNTVSIAPYTGDGASGCKVYGGQLELHRGYQATSLIDTTAIATASRAADYITVPLSSISTWTNSRFTMAVRFKAPRVSDTSGNIMSVSDGTDNNTAYMRMGASAWSPRSGLVVAGSNTQNITNGPNFNTGNLYTMLFGFETGQGTSHCGDGTLQTTSSIAGPSGLTVATLGCTGGGNTPFYGIITEARIFNTRLSNGRIRGNAR